MTISQHKYQPDEAALLRQFLKLSENWGLPVMLSALGKQDIWVSDPDIVQSYREYYGDLTCRVDSAGGALEKRYEGQPTILVLCRQGEWALVKRLRHLYPKAQVFSVSYEVAANNAMGQSQLHWQGELPGRSKKSPTFIVSLPYSQAEYFSQTLGLNGHPVSYELIGRASAIWAKISSDYNPVRLFWEIERRYGQGKGLYMLVQFDVLQGLIEHSGLTWRHVSDYLTATEAKVIYYSRRNKLLQAMEATLLSTLNLRSLSQLAGGSLSEEDFNPSEADQWVEDLLRQEVKLEGHLSLLPELKMITHEEMKESPVEVLKSVSVYLGKKAKLQVMVPDWDQPVQTLAALHDVFLSYREAYANRLGFVMSSRGTWEHKPDES